MIEKWEDLDFKEEDTLDEIETKVQAKLEIPFSLLRERLSSYVQEHVNTLVEDFVNIAPFGDYSKLIEDRAGMIEFLRTEAHKTQHWKLRVVQPSEINPTLLSFEFGNEAVDDGASCSGFVYVSFHGKIKHAFAQGDV